MTGNGFDNVKDQIGFCGISCGSCAAANGAVIELTKKYAQLVDKYHLEKWVPRDFDFKELRKGLGSIQTMSLCSGCRKNGGNPACEVRTCAMRKNIADCSQCGALMNCSAFEDLEKNYPKIRHELAKIKNTNPADLIQERTNELKAKWPHCIVLCESGKN